MLTIKNGQISLFCHFNKMVKGPGTSFQSPALGRKHVRNVCHNAQYYLTKFHFDSTQDSTEISVKFNFHYVAMSIMTSQILKSVDFTKTRSKYLENETLFFLQVRKFINCTSTLLQKIVFY